MPVARPESHDARVIAHVDMDCFYVQVEQRKNPELRGLPTAVVQYNSWKGGGLIAVGYEARKFGVKRSMRGDEAKKVCPDINLVKVPTARGKADLNLYRDAGSEVVSILSTKGRCERASIDEVYLDLTDAAECMLSETPDKMQEIDEEVLKSHVLGLSEDAMGGENLVKDWMCRCDNDHQDKLLACGAIIVAQLRRNVLEQTTFTCSAGIAHNKMLAKLASAMHKPAQQTVVLSSSVKNLLSSLPVKKMKQLGGKLGSSLQNDLGINTVGDLLHFSEETLQQHYGTNTGTWLWNIARGINGEEVQDRLLPKSHGSGKTFPGPQALRSASAVECWLNELCEELNERIQTDLDKNRRIAQTLTLHASAFKANDLDSHKKFPSKSCPLRYGATKIKEDAVKLFDSALKDYMGVHSCGWGVTSLSVSASKIVAIPSGTSSILKFFHGMSSPTSSAQDSSGLMFEGPPSELSHHDHLDARMQMNMADATSALPQNISRKEISAQKEKRKEKSSILNFFHASNTTCTSSDQGSGGRLVYNGTSSSTLSEGECSLSRKKDENSKFNNESIEVEESSGNAVRTVESWKYYAEDIDASVVAELPPEIQREVQQWLRPHKHAKPAKRSTIADYFNPAKK